MAQYDFAEATGRQAFQAYLREKITEEIKFDLMVNKIVDPEQRALAEIEIERRREENQMSHLNADLADYQKRLRHQKWAIYTSAVGMMVAFGSATAAWLA